MIFIFFVRHLEYNNSIKPTRLTIDKRINYYVSL